MPLIPGLRRQRQADFLVRGQPCLQSEFQCSQGYMEKPCIEQTKKKKKMKENIFPILFLFLIIYFLLFLHFKCYPLSYFPLQKSPSPYPCSPTHPLLLPSPGIPLYLGIELSQAQGPLLPLKTD